MTSTYPGHEILYHFYIFSIIEDKQPATITFQPTFDSLDGKALILSIVFRQFQQLGNRPEVQDQLLTFLSLNPKHIRVLIIVAVRVFHSNLCFTNTAQTTNRTWLCQCSCHASPKLVV